MQGGRSLGSQKGIWKVNVLFVVQIPHERVRNDKNMMRSMSDPFIQITFSCVYDCGLHVCTPMNVRVVPPVPSSCAFLASWTLFGRCFRSAPGPAVFPALAGRRISGSANASPCTQTRHFPPKRTC